MRFDLSWKKKKTPRCHQYISRYSYLSVCAKIAHAPRTSPLYPCIQLNPEKLRWYPPRCSMCLLHAQRGAKNTSLHSSVWMNPCALAWALRVKATDCATVVAAKLIGPRAPGTGRPLENARSLQNLFGPFGRWLLPVSCWRGLLASQPTPGQPWGRRGNFWLQLLCVLHVLIADLGRSRCWHFQNLIRLTFRQVCILCRRSRQVPNEPICVVHVGLLGLQSVELCFQVSQKVAHVELLIAVLRFGVCARAILQNNLNFFCFISFWFRTWSLLQTAQKRKDMSVLVLLSVRFAGVCRNTTV